MALRTGILAGSELAEVRETIIAPDSPFRTTNLSDTGVIFDIDVSGYPTAVVTLFGSYTGLAISWELFRGLNGQEDTDWVAATPVNAVTPSASHASGYLGTSQVLIFPTVGAQRFRARQTIAPTVDKCHIHVALVASPLQQFVYGQSPDNAALAGWPVRIGARAVSSVPSVVTTGRASDLIGTLDRRLVVCNDVIPEVTWSYAAASGGITDTTAVTIKAAAASGIRNYLRSLQVFNSAAVASEFSVRDGSGGTVLYRGYVPASMTVVHSLNFNPPLRGTAATLMEVVMATTATATRFNAQGWSAA